MDSGDIKLDVDLSTGMMRIGVRTPLALESGRVWAPISVMEFQEHAANLTLATIQFARDAFAQLRNGTASADRRPA